MRKVEHPNVADLKREIAALKRKVAILERSVAENQLKDIESSTRSRTRKTSSKKMSQLALARPVRVPSANTIERSDIEAKANVLAQATKVYGKSRVHLWLNLAHPDLDGRTPSAALEAREFDRLTALLRNTSLRASL